MADLALLALTLVAFAAMLLVMKRDEDETDEQSDNSDVDRILRDRSRWRGRLMTCRAVL